MQVHEKFIVYGTPKAPATGGAREASPLTRGAWQSEMTDWLALFDNEEAAFTPVAETRDAAAPRAIPPEAAAEHVENREGLLLGPGMLLKADQYPGIHKRELERSQKQIPGAPNYRALSAGNGASDGERNVRGVAQPTIDGIRGVLDDAGAGPGGDGKAAIWTNLREEPVVYLNGRPFNLRDSKHPFANLVNASASGRDIERQEDQLKDDILKEAAKNGGRLLIHDEGPDGKVTSRWETVTPESVRTTKEVYNLLKQEGYKVDYKRIPVTDEKRPEEKDVDELVNRLKDVDPDAPMIFNCHAGRGRTTTGMVIAGLLRRAQNDSDKDESVTRSRPVHEDIREQGKYKRGEYKVILGLIDVLERGPKSKQEADAVIDQYADLQNLRESIEKLKVQSETGATAEQRKEARERGQDYLERYFYTIAFDAYAKEQAPGGFKQPFSEWMKERPELKGMLGNVELAMGMQHRGEPPTMYA
ncbi:MAG: hypothetical protein FJX76_20775 [Armatimonadetes bacterium]|nr:hypothetical protein [Armatimonadota bacterium]